MQVLLATCGAWHLPHTAKHFETRNALAGLWISNKNSAGVSPARYRRCWPFHLLMKPFYHCAPQIWTEHAFYKFFPVWRAWIQNQQWPKCDVVQAIMGYASEPFDWAGKNGALKVIDCANSHPVTQFGFCQREFDLWCPGEKMPVPQWMFARMNRELERADVVIVQSDFCKESMILNGIPAEKILVNPMGVDTSIFKQREQVPTKPRFISVGTICLRKGHQYLFRAFELVKQSLPAAELICVGNIKCDFRKELPKWEGKFTHIPSLSHAALAELLPTCTAFVFPSQEEGIARAQIEALACGLPVIGTHEGGATTLVKDGVEGFIVRGRDPGHIAEAMLSIASDPVKNQKMGDAAYLKGAVRNSWQDYADRLLAEYQIRLKQ
jgi:starch synthase